MAINANSSQETYNILKPKLERLMPDAEIRVKAELAYEVNRLKAERGAIILGHNYMEPALYYSVADELGDSLELSRKAAKTEKSPIIFCGVRFMAETAKILNPDKLVLLPAEQAGCSLASSITAEDVRNLKAKYPGVPVVTYINTYADVKAECDICCTSGNAARVVQSLDSDTVIFLPDEFLAKNVARETGKNIIIADLKQDQPKSLGIIGWKGRCEVHEKFTVDDITRIRKQFPGVLVLAHPECSPEVVVASDCSASTSKMIAYIQESKAPSYLILTECAMGDNIIAANPDKEIIRLCNIRCPHMNEITLAGVLRALREDYQTIEVPHDIAIRARRSLERMLEI